MATYNILCFVYDNNASGDNAEMFCVMIAGVDDSGAIQDYSEALAIKYDWTLNGAIALPTDFFPDRVFDGINWFDREDLTDIKIVQASELD